MSMVAGHTLGGYRLEHLLGTGSMGTVYVAEDVRLGRRVALKVLRSELAEDERFRQRFLQESQLAASLEHPHIVPIYAAGEEAGSLYLAMRLVEGPDLRRVLRERHHLEPSRAVGLLAQAASALDAAHAVGLVHRDVKPANLLGVSGSPVHAYLCDFGLAKHAASADSLTGDDSFVGTISYVAPEQIEGGPVDGRSDQYALGCVLFECLTGERPFERESELQTLFAHLREDPPSASEIEPALGTELDAVLARALAKDPAERFETCTAMVVAAADALEVPVEASGTTSVPGIAATSSRRRGISRRTAVGVVALGAATLAIGAIVAALTLRDGTSFEVAPHGLAVFDRASGKPEWQVAFDSDPTWAVVDGRTAYVDLPEEGNFAVVDLDERTVRKRIAYPPGIEAVGPVIGNTMWVSGPDDKVVPLDLRYGTAGEPLALDKSGDYQPEFPWLAVGDGVLWVAYGSSPPRVARVDPRSRRVVATIRLPKITDFSCCGVIAVDGHDVWVGDRGSGNLWRIDARTNEVVATGTLNGGWVGDLAAEDGYAFAPRESDAGVWRIDQTLANPRFVETGVWPHSSTPAAERVWVANRNAGTVSELDPTTNEVVDEIDVRGAPLVAAASGDDLVVALAERPADPYAGLDGSIATAFATNDPLWETDPAVGTIDLADRVQIHDAIDLKLVRVVDDDGDGIQTLVADGAELPVVSDGGRTWRFRIRPGNRFSPPSGAKVTATVFRDSIERALSPEWGDWSNGWPPGGAHVNYLEDLVGLDAFQSGKARHIAGLEVDGETLVFHLARPLRDLAARVALQPYAAVPPGTPVVEGGLKEPLPSAGPYHVTKHALNAYIVLERNPYYPGPRAPELDAIVYQALVGNEAAVARMKAGEGDFVARLIDQTTGARSPLLAGGGELERAYSGGPEPRFVTVGSLFTWFLSFNTLRPPFDDVRLRRAVATAVDRTELATAWDGTPADLFLPAGLPSHRPQGSTFPLTADAAEARRLAGGFRGPITLATDPRRSMQEMAESIKRQLGRIGIEVEIVLDWGRRQNASTYDVVLDSWFLDYIDPAVTFGPLLTPATAGYEQYPVYEPPLFADRLWLARVRAVEQAPARTRDAAYARLDRELSRGPLPLAALGHGEMAWFFSERVGCGRGVGAWPLPDLAALCVR